MDAKCLRLIAERERLKLNQTEFGALGGVARSAQSNYESGTRAPDWDYLARLHDEGVDVAFVLTGAPSAKLARDEAELLTAFRTADAVLKSAALRVLLPHAAAGQSVVSAPTQTIHGDNNGQQVGGNVTAERQTFIVGGKRKR